MQRQLGKTHFYSMAEISVKDPWGLMSQSYFLKLTAISSEPVKYNPHVPKEKIFVLSSNSSLLRIWGSIEVDKSPQSFVLQILQKGKWNILSTMKMLIAPSYSWFMSSRLSILKFVSRALTHFKRNLSLLCLIYERWNKPQMKTSKVQANSAVEMVISNIWFNAKQDTYKNAS